MERTIYFDNGSTSWPKAPGVAEAVQNYFANGAFNINRGNYEGAYDVSAKVLACRERLARLFHVKSSKQVIFTPGITYSLNYFIKGYLRANDHVIVSGLEHNAVMRPLFDMMGQGVSYDIAKTDMEGELDLDDLKNLIRSNTKAVIVTHASNVCGSILPLKEIGEICKEKQLFFVVDSAQSAGSIEIDFEGWGIDFLAFTGHKGLLGPQGIGGFVISEALDREMKPLIMGGTGSQSNLLSMPKTLPDKYESGTMNLPGILGLEASLTYIEELGLERIFEKKMALTAYFLERLKELPDLRIVGKKDCQKRVAVVSVEFLARDNAMVAFELEQQAGIMTRVGLHCAPIAHQTLGSFPSGTVRFTFSASNTKEEIDTCIDCLKNL